MIEMKPPFDIAADMDTPVSAYRKLRAFGPTFLLESVEGGQRLARYSFIGLGKAGSIRLDSRGLAVNGVYRAVEPGVKGREAVFEALRSCIAAAPALLPEAGLPLAGGLVGMIGYDFVRRIEKLGEKPAAFGVGGDDEPEIAMVAPRSMLVFDHLSRRVALLHGGAEWERQSLRREIIAALRGGVGEPSVKSGHEPPTGSLSRDEYIDRVGKVKEHIRAGDVFQLVLSVRFGGACVTEPFEVYRALRLLNPSPYMFFLELDDTKLIGSSPEALVKLSAGEATLRPIAGTRPRGSDEEADAKHERELLADPKENAEHVMLVDLARNDLGRVAEAGSIRVKPYRSIERYSHVMHIVSGVSGRLRKDCDAVDLLAATFPAGTVVGAPKVRAMQIIDELEPVRRGFYAGTVGYFGKGGDMDQAIAIRTLCFRNGRYAYQAGAGIVADSNAGAEYDEVRHKVGALEAALRLAEQGL
jgi:anthranilate synthase component 1